MRWRDEITLIKLTLPTDGGADENAAATNDNGFPVEPTETPTTVFCNKKSVGFNEFYKAQMAGINAVLKVDVYATEYDGQELAELDGVRYTVLRIYADVKSGDLLELTLSKDIHAKGGGLRG